MEQASIIQYISEMFSGVDVAVALDDSFFIYDPERNLEPTRRFPFATLVTNNNYDSVSNLNRPSVFRLNIGVSKQTFRSLFGADAKEEYDFTALDQFMPHPVYGRMHWICVLNPSDATFEQVKIFLAEAYEITVNRINKSKS